MSINFGIELATEELGLSMMQDPQSVKIQSMNAVKTVAETMTSHYEGSSKHLCSRIFGKEKIFSAQKIVLRTFYPKIGTFSILSVFFGFLFWFT